MLSTPEDPLEAKDHVYATIAEGEVSSSEIPAAPNKASVSHLGEHVSPRGPAIQRVVGPLPRYRRKRTRQGRGFQLAERCKVGHRYPPESERENHGVDENLLHRGCSAPQPHDRASATAPSAEPMKGPIVDGHPV